MRTFWTLFTLGMLSVALAAPLFSADVPTHKPYKNVKITGETGTNLITIANAPDGKIAALVGHGGNAALHEALSAEIRLLDADGAEVRKWDLPFAGQSIAVAPNGSIYVAGDGKVARYSADGKLQASAEVPHIAEVLKDSAKIRELAEAQLKLQRESYEKMIVSFKEQVKVLRDKAAKAEKPEKAEGKLTDDETETLKELEGNLKIYEDAARIDPQNIDATVVRLTARLRSINSITATDKDVFISCGELKGYGYAAWRMDSDFKNPTQVLSKLGGCCGQMDLQAQGERLYVAENTRHRVAYYDRDGKPVNSFGKRSREESDGECFGGCCNPMNCRICSSGDVFTSESEGVIKKFNAKGEFVSTAANIKLKDGCKNVAVASSPSGDRLYLCDQSTNQIFILAQRTPEEMKAAAAQQAAEEKNKPSALRDLLNRFLN